MDCFYELQAWRTQRKALPDQRIGLVPTMGNLHQGHLSLIQRSKTENELTVVSLFVNPTQFNNPEDFTHYPRTLDADLALLREAQVDYCLIPDANDMYSEKEKFSIQEDTISTHLEGKHRPGHFNGVLTVLMKLLHLVQPSSVYFGEKDYQQYQLIRNMAAAFFMDVEVKACQTIRESSGLAFSSRNNRLNAAERELADQFANIFHQTKPCATLIAELEALGLRVDYLEDYLSRRYVAAYVGPVRLIDNYALEEADSSLS